MKRTISTMATQPTTKTNATTADIPAEQDNKEESATPAETPQSVQRSQTDIKVLKTCEMLKADADAVNANVRNARELDESLNPAVAPLTVFCRNLGVLDDPAKLDNPVIGATQDALDIRDLPVKMTNLIEMAQLVASGLKAPDLSNLDNEDINNEADTLRKLVDAAEYVDISEDVLNVAKLALAAYHASRSNLRDWVNKSNRVVPSNTGTKGPRPSNGSKLASTDKIREKAGFDVQYICNNCDKIGYEGGTTYSGVKHAIRGHYRDCRGLTENETDGSSAAFRELGEAMDKVLDSPNPAQWVGGVIHRVAPRA